MNNSKKITMIMAALAVAVAFAIIAIPAFAQDDSAATPIEVDSGITIDFESDVDFGTAYGGITSNAVMGNEATITYDEETGIDFIVTGTLFKNDLTVPTAAPFYKMWPGNDSHPYAIVFNVTCPNAGDIISVGGGVDTVTEKDNEVVPCILYLDADCYNAGRIGAFFYTPADSDDAIMYIFNLSNQKTGAIPIDGTSLTIDFEKEVDYKDNYGNGSNDALGNVFEDITFDAETKTFTIEGTLDAQNLKTPDVNSAFYKLWPGNDSYPYGIVFNVTGASEGDKFNVGTGAEKIATKFDKTFQCMLYLTGEGSTLVGAFSYLPAGADVKDKVIYKFDLSAAVPSDAVAYNANAKAYYADFKAAIEEASAGDVIELLADCAYAPGDGKDFAAVALIINGNGKKITMGSTLVDIAYATTFNNVKFVANNLANNMFDIQNNVDVTFAGCEFSGDCSTASKMNFIQANENYTATLTISGCTFDMTGEYVNRAVRSVVNNGTVTVTNCVFTGTTGLYDQDTPVKVSGTGYATALTASGNKLNGEDLITFDLGDAVVLAIPVAKIGNTNFATLAAALAAATSGQTIDILANCTYTAADGAAFSAVPLVINGNGKTITMNATLVNLTSNITFNNVVFTAATTNNLFDIRTAIAVQVVFSDCTFNGKSSGSEMNFIQAAGSDGESVFNGSLTVSGCTFDMTDASVNRAVRSVLGSGSVTVIGSTFNGTGGDKDTPVKVSGTGYVTALAASGNKQIKGEDIIDIAIAEVGSAVALTDVKDYEAKIGDVHYSTLAAAMAAAKSGDNVILIADVTIDAATTIPADWNMHISKDTRLSLEAALTIKGGLTVAGELSVLTGGSIDVQKTLVINTGGSVYGDNGQPFTFNTAGGYIINSGTLDVRAESLSVSRPIITNTIENNGTILGTFPGETETGTTTEESLIAQVEAGSDDIVLSKDITVATDVENKDAVISLQEEKAGLTKDHALIIEDAKITATVIGGDGQEFFLDGLTAQPGKTFKMWPGSLNLTGAIDQGMIVAQLDGIIRLINVTIAGDVVIEATDAAYVYAMGVEVASTGSLTFGDNVTVFGAESITGSGSVTVYDAVFEGSNASSAYMTINNRAIVSTDASFTVSRTSLASSYYVMKYVDTAFIELGSLVSVKSIYYSLVDDPDYLEADTIWAFIGWQIGSTVYSPDFSEFDQGAVSGKVFTVSAAVPEYTITWKIGETTLSTSVVEYGVVPAYGGSTPSKTDAEYTYTFVGWNTDPEATSAGPVAAATANVPYYAIFLTEPKTYTVTWKDYDGTTIDVDYDVAYGTKVSTIQPADPASYSTGISTFTFKAWTPSIVEDTTVVKADITYTATYTETAKTAKMQYALTVSLVDDKATVGGITLGDGQYYPYGNDAYLEVSFLYYNSAAKKTVYDYQGSAVFCADYVTIDYTSLFTGNGDFTTEYGNPVGVVVVMYCYQAGNYVIIGSTEYYNNMTVTFDVNGGSAVTPSSVPVSYGKLVAEPDPETELAGHTLVGWFLGDEEWNFTTDKVMTNITLKAKWSTDAYTVNFAPDYPAYGSVVPDKVTSVPYGTVIHIEDNVLSFTVDEYTYVITATPTAETAEFKYSFDGWSVSDLDTITGPTDITAYFVVATQAYTVTVTANDFESGTIDAGTIDVSYDDVLYGYTITIVDGTITIKNGETPVHTIVAAANADTAEYTYGFTGFKVGGEDYTGGSVASDIEIEAQFTRVKNTYTVNFVPSNPAYGSVEPDKVTSVPYGTVLNVDDNVISFTIGEVEYIITATPKGDTAEFDYAFVEWDVDDGDIVAGATTITATFSQETRKYNITWMNGAEDLGTVPTDYGTVPAYGGAPPTKAATAQYTYTFIGWNVADNMEEAIALPTVAGNATYYAQYSKVVNTYTVVWKNAAATLETDAGVSYGTIPTYDGETPEKAATAQYTYTFIGWNIADDMEEAIAIPAVTGNATYYAQYSKVVNTYTVNISSNNVAYGTVDLDQVTSVPYGTEIAVDDDEISFTVKGVNYTIKATPTESTPAILYSFTSWNIADGYKVTGLTNIIASFDKSDRTYEVTWMNGEDEIKTDDVLYEAVPAYVGATPTKDATAQYTYTFIGWNVADDMEVALDEPLPAVTADITYYAQYSKVVNTYTITWKNAETTLETDVGVAYGTVPTYDGAAPTKASTAQYDFTFIGWNIADDMEVAIDIPAVEGNATYYAQYSKETRTYTVNIASNNDDWGTVDLGQVTSVPYGTVITVAANKISFTVGEVEYEITATAHEDDLTYYYHFDGWSIADEYEVVGATDIEATFSVDPVIYSVTVYVDDEAPVEKIVLYKGSYKIGIGSDSSVVLKDENDVVIDEQDSFHGVYTVSEITGEWTLIITKN